MIAKNNSQLHKRLLQFKSRDSIKLTCPQCSNSFERTKNYIQSKFGQANNRKALFCSRDCMHAHRVRSELVECRQCQSMFTKDNADIKRTKNNFCSRNCFGIWHNAHKTHGYRRSKIEIQLEEHIKIFMPHINMFCNYILPVSAELDFYFPDLNMAFELNGIFHYEPIYGIAKLTSTQATDKRKYEYCRENHIELVIIDISSVKRWSAERVEEYLLLCSELLTDAIFRRK